MSAKTWWSAFYDYFIGKLVLPQRRWHTVVAVAILLITCNTLFLLARRFWLGCEIGGVARCSISPFYQSMVLTHSAIGIVMSALLVAFLVFHLRSSWSLGKERLAKLITGLLVIGVTTFLLVSGLYFMLEAKTKSMMWLYYSHIGAAVIFIAVYLGHRHVSRPTMTARIGGAFASGVLALGAVLVVLEAVEAPPQPLPIVAADLFDYDGSYEQPNKVSTTHEFFPSAVQLASAQAATTSEKVIGQMPKDPEAIRAEVKTQGFASSTPIGAEKCVRCHEAITKQWAASVHRFSSFNNPYYVATIEFMRENTGPPNPELAKHMEEMGMPDDLAGRAKSRWCAACHDPALLLAGKMMDDVDRGSVAAQAGLTCLSCHLIEDIPNHTGNGNFVWNDTFEDSYIFSDAEDGLGAGLHDIYLNANPERHRSDMMKPFYGQSEFCATCHKVSLDLPVNDYRWLRGQNEYDAWHNSGVAHNAARTFYLPPSRRECQACHMPLVEAKLHDAAADNGKVRDHTFGSANTALPFLRGDQEAIDAIEAFLQDDSMRLHFGGIRQGEGEVRILSPDQPHAVEASGDGIEFHLVVRNLKVGHAFPGGTNDSNESWLEVVVHDADGRPVASVGQIDESGTVERDTRFYHSVMVDKSGGIIDKRNAQNAITAAYVKLIGPGTSDVVRFKLPARVLEEAAFPLTVNAKLQWRKFTQIYNSFAFNTNPEGFPGFDKPPVLPVSTITSAQATVQMTEDGLAIALEGEQPPVDIGLHDYAIGLLLQGDTSLARPVASQAARTNPACFNCRRTEITVMLRDGRFAEAREALTALEKDDERNPQTAWLWAKLLMREGRFAGAEKALDYVLGSFKGDREAMKLKARAAYLDGRHEDALTYARDALAIDPEDFTANYYALLAAKAMDDTETIAFYEAAFSYHKPDEAAQQATLSFRQRAEDINFGSQAIQVFEIR